MSSSHVHERRSDSLARAAEGKPGDDTYRPYAARYDAVTEVFAPYQHRAVSALGLSAGEVVVDVGCGTGVCFAALVEAVGPTGQVIGVDRSPAMLALARSRADSNRWENAAIIESPADAAQLPTEADAALFCATHDILRSRSALEQVLGQVRPGGRVAAVGSKWAAPWLGPLNVAVFVQNKPYVSSFEGFDRPWSHLETMIEQPGVESLAFGAGYLATGRRTG